MAEAGEAQKQPTMEATLGLTGVTVNAMALIAPGAFLWITFVVQAGYSYPSGMTMWAGILAPIALAFEKEVANASANAARSTAHIVIPDG